MSDQLLNRTYQSTDNHAKKSTPTVDTHALAQACFDDAFDEDIVAEMKQAGIIACSDGFRAGTVAQMELTLDAALERANITTNATK
jgi:hypothetical protein